MSQVTLCPWCAAPFTSKKVGAHRKRFCSPRCKDRYHAATPELIEPTEDEARNGWDAENLTAYLAERERAQSDRLSAIFNRRPSRPRWANSRYSPFRWRARA